MSDERLSRMETEALQALRSSGRYGQYGIAPAYNIQISRTDGYSLKKYDDRVDEIER